MRPFASVTLALIVAIPAVCAADAPTAGADVSVQATAPGTSVAATMAKHANVRYGPSTNSKPVCMLDAGTPIEILGPAPAPDWYTIRFPQQGQAWVHSKVLAPLDGGKRWKVTVDGAKARDDSRLNGNIVAELAVGEVLEDRGRAISEWHAVYIPSAVAYVHKSVITLPDAKAMADQSQRGQQADAAWTQAQATYASYYATLQANADTALTLDWAGLSQQLDLVIKSHPDAGVRIAAQRVRDGIARVESAATALQQSRGITPVKHAPSVDGTTPTAPGATSPQIAGVPAPPTAANTAQGFVSENSDYPRVGATALLIDGNSNIVAFLKLKPEATVQLSEYYWRWVGVKGEAQPLDKALHGLDRDIPLILVEDVTLGKK